MTLRLVTRLRWFLSEARHYGRHGVHLSLPPLPFRPPVTLWRALCSSCDWRTTRGVPPVVADGLTSLSLSLSFAVCSRTLMEKHPTEWCFTASCKSNRLNSPPPPLLLVFSLASRSVWGRGGKDGKFLLVLFLMVSVLSSFLSFFCVVLFVVFDQVRYSHGPLFLSLVVCQPGVSHHPLSLPHIHLFPSTPVMRTLRVILNGACSWVFWLFRYCPHTLCQKAEES